MVLRLDLYLSYLICSESVRKCTAVCLFKMPKNTSDSRNKSPVDKNTHMQFYSPRSVFSIRTTPPVVHRLTVIISQTQTPPSDTDQQPSQAFLRSAFRKLKLDSEQAFPSPSSTFHLHLKIDYSLKVLSGPFKLQKCNQITKL